MSGDKLIFTNLDVTYHDKVKLGDKSKIQDSKAILIAEATKTANQMFPLFLHVTNHICFSTRLKDVA